MAYVDASEPSFTVPADSSKSWEKELPPGVWREVLQHLSVQERFVACMVCKAWRCHALSLLIPDLEVCLNSGAAADGFKAWLAAHSRQLASLTLTEFYFSHHGFSAPAAGAAMRSRLGQVARVKLWQGLHGGGHALQHLHTLKVQLDDVSDRDACCIGLCVMPALTHLTLESNASAIGVTGAAGLVPLTSLRELVLPSQALGDQGLQYICNALVNLEALNVHNDGHVTDDGMVALASLTALTALDLQGNVSITQAAMPTLAAAAPRLRKLNLAWLAMVNDWGLGQLSCLTDLQELDLRATGVQLKTATATAALSNLTSLTRLDMSRCRLEPLAMHAVASSVPSIQNLSLASTALNQSFTELQPLQQLSSLTKLDLSSNALAPADAEHIVVFSMTQLRHLALNCVVMDKGMSDLLTGWLRIDAPEAASAKEKGEEESTAETPGPDAEELSVQEVDDIITRELLAAAAPIAAALQPAFATSAHAQQPPATADATGGPTVASSSSRQQPAAAAAAAPNSTGVQTPWGRFLMRIVKLPHLTALEFADNGSSWMLPRSLRPHGSAAGASIHQVCPGEINPVKVSVIEPALLLLSFAAAQHTALRSLHFVNPEHTSQHATAQAHTSGELQGQWNTALQFVAAAILRAIGYHLESPGLTGAFKQEGTTPAAGQQQQQQLEQLVGSMRVEGAVHNPTPGSAKPYPMQHQVAVLDQQGLAVEASPGGDSTSRSISSSSGVLQRGFAAQGSRGLSDAAKQRLLVLLRKLQQRGERAKEQMGAELYGPNALPESVYLSLSVAEASEALQMLLPGLHNVYFAF